MGIFDSLFSLDPDHATPAPPKPLPPYATLPGTGGATMSPDYMRQLLENMAAAREKASASFGFIPWLTGAGRDAAKATADAAAPDAYNAYSTGNTAAINGRVGLAQTLGRLSALSGKPIDPGNPVASAPDLGQAFLTFLQGAQGSQSQPANAQPQNSGPQQAEPDNQAWKNFQANNPGNMRTPDGKGWQTFPDLQTGMNAIDRQLGLYGSRGINTVNKVVSTWAPSSDGNDVGAYAQDVATHLGVKPDEPLNMQDPQVVGALRNAIITHEQGPTNIARFQAQSQGGQPQAQNADPAQQQRGLYNRLALWQALSGDTQGFAGLNTAANAGRPDDSVLAPTGAFVPSVVQTPGGTQTGQAFEAQGAQLKAAGTQAGTNSQTPKDVMTDKGPGVISTGEYLASRGQPQTNADGSYKWLPTDSPQYKAIQGAQQADLDTSKKDAQSASAGLNTAQQLYNAAHGLYTGRGAESVQAWRKAAIALNQLGLNVDPNITNDAAKFEQLKYATLNFVQSAAHSFSPRAALQVVRMIQTAKPGEATTPQGLAKIILNEVLPTFLQQRAAFGATSNYYQQNPLKQDAAAVVPNRIPLANFGVKSDLGKVQPGDYFLDPRNGALRQRPGQ